MRKCKDPHRFCYKYDGQCCMKCEEMAKCEKGCSWTYIDCFLAEEVQSFRVEAPERNRLDWKADAVAL